MGKRKRKDGENETFREEVSECWEKGEGMRGDIGGWRREGLSFLKEE